MALCIPSKSKSALILKSILITGPESSGKSTLARQLAWATDGVYVPEFARDFLQKNGDRYTESDLRKILDGQLLAAQNAKEQSPDSLLVCDTGPYVLYIWSEVKYQRIAPKIARAVADTAYDLILLCKPDLAWQPDPLREHPDQGDRDAIFSQYVKLLEKSGREYKVVSGENRIEQAMEYLFICCQASQ